MKKTILAVAIFLSGFCVSYAQEAFKSLSFGIELGTTGVGVELAVPVVTDHIVLKAGFNAPSLAVNKEFSVDSGFINQKIDQFNNQITSLGLDASDVIDTRFSDTKLNFSPIINFSTAKILIELYPFKKSSFHFTLGACYGMGDYLANATLSTSKSLWTEYKSLCDEINSINAKYANEPGYNAFSTELEFNVVGRTYAVKENNGVGQIAVDMPVAKLRPYLGLGFGRSVPEGHVGFQFDLGVWYHGKPSFTSPNQIGYDSGAYDITSHIPMLDLVLQYKELTVFYPQLTLRLIYKIF